MATLARSMARRQLLGLILVGVLGGLGVGLVMTAAAGARRADSAYTRLGHESLAPDAMFGADGLDDQTIGQLAALPEVAGIARFGYAPIAPEPLTPGIEAGAFVGLDADFLFRVYRPVVLSGRLPDPDAGDEVVINEALAQVADLEPGQQVQLSSGFGTTVPIGSATVVGVVRGIFDVGANSGNPSMLVGKAFLDQHRPDILVGPQPFGIARFVNGEADLADFQRHASAVSGHEFSLFSGDDEAKPTERTLAVQRVGLTILAAIAAVATLAAVTQAFSRQLDRALADLPILVAIGLQPRQRLGLGLGLGALFALPVAIVGAPVATLVSFLASPLIPTGFARRVDPVRGLQLDVLVVSGAIAVWMLALGGAGLVLAWRKNGRPRSTSGLGRARRLLRALPLQSRLGGEAALVPVRGAGGAASRAAMVTAALSVTVIVAVTTFGASLDHLLATDALQGWNFDLAISTGETGLAALGMLAVGHGLWASIRARRRDLFVLSSLGFRPSDLRAMLLAQANCLALVGAAFGLIAGIIIGQRAWSLVADSTAVVDQFVLSIPELIAITAGSIAAASLIGIAAAHWMRQIRTADGLRTD